VVGLSGGVLLVEILVGVDVIISELTKMSFAIIERFDCRAHHGQQSTDKLQKTRIFLSIIHASTPEFLTRVVPRYDLIRQKCLIIGAYILGRRSNFAAKRLLFGDLQTRPRARGRVASSLLG
jgi:hypothetical protein